MRYFGKNREKNKEKRKRRYREQHALCRLLREHASDILNSENFKQTRGYVQHGDIAVHRHCMDVANQSIRLGRLLHLHCNERALVRGALLHDYFLYDWHDKNRENYQKWHGFFHPGIALRNAKKEYNLSRREEDIIKKHMWPLTIVPPTCREAWVVTAADKYCSLLETLHLRRKPVKVYTGDER